MKFYFWRMRKRIKCFFGKRSFFEINNNLENEKKKKAKTK